jgi:hypothetical protein
MNLNGARLHDDGDGQILRPHRVARQEAMFRSGSILGGGLSPARR